MRDETPPWVEAMVDSSPTSVDPRVLVGTGLWIVVFGWYVILRATPAFGLTAIEAALLYAGCMFLVGLCFGWGEEQVSTTFIRSLDRSTLALGGLALSSAGLSWFLLTTSSAPYTGGLWLGVVLLVSGVLVGAALR